MLQAPTIAPNHPFSHENLIEAYQNLDFTKRSQALELFLVVDSPLPKRNPPSDSSMFPGRTKQITTILSYLLGYNSDQYVDEAILGFSSIFSDDSKPIVLYNFSQFLAKTIHEHLSSLILNKYSSMLQHLYIFLYVFRETSFHSPYIS